MNGVYIIHIMGIISINNTNYKLELNDGDDKK